MSDSCKNPRCKKIEQLLRTLVVYTEDSVERDREVWKAMKEGKELFGVNQPEKQNRKNKIEKGTMNLESIKHL